MDVVTLVIAIVGLVIALLSAVWQVATWFWSTARPRAQLMHGILTGDGGAMAGPVSKDAAPFPLASLRRQGYDGPEVIGIEVVNHGRAPMTVSKYGVVHVESRHAYTPIGDAIGPPTPHRIQPGESASWYTLVGTAKALIDAVGRSSSSGHVRLEATLGTGKVIMTKQSIDLT